MQFIPTAYKNVGEEFTFKNNIGEEVKLEVLSYEFSIEEGGGIGTSKPLHIYDVLEIELKTTDSEMGCDFKTIIVSKWGGYLITRFKTRTFSEPCSSFSNGDKLEFPYEVTSMTIDGTTYDKVVSIFVDMQPYFSRDYAFHTVYFDFKHGIIGFDGEEDNSQFRLVGK